MRAAIYLTQHPDREHKGSNEGAPDDLAYRSDLQQRRQGSRHLESLHWPNGPVCPRCGDTDRVRRATGKSTRPGVVVCNPCRRPFTVTVGTVLEDSKIPLNKWLLAFRLMAGSKKGMGAHQLHRSLGITYKSAWFLGHRIREAMNMEPEGPLGRPDAVVEADEPMSAASQKPRYPFARSEEGGCRAGGA